MLLGLSSYSMSRAITNGDKSIADVIHWIAAQGGEHVEIVPIGFDLMRTPELIPQIRTVAQEAGIAISNYAIGANFIQESEAQVEEEIAKVKEHVDIAHAFFCSEKPQHRFHDPYQRLLYASII